MRTELIDVKSTVRAESGAARLTAVATAEMEPDRDRDGRVLEPNKQTRRVVLKKGAKLAAHYKLGIRDALGKPIVEGEEFTYLGYFDPPVWYVYRLEDVPIDDGLPAKIAAKNGVPLDGLTVAMVAKWFSIRVDWVTDGGSAIKRWMPAGVKPTKDEALMVANALEDK